MDRPRYDGLMQPWKIDLIVNRAKRLGFREHELPDILQELVLAMSQFKYDHAHTTGAQERTVLCSFIDKQLKARQRAARRYQAKLDRLGRLARPAICEDKLPLVLDVRLAVAVLSPREQAICAALADGLTRTQIAERFGCGWHTIEGIIQHIRKQFEATGLGGWLGEEAESEPSPR